ncbi:MAG: helix-turn-helix transcriptional regulator [Lachnospiraceae bacterium]|nr:helix-turn-helix transcriptional regulator [Lachnospiraceae bacterium]
MFTVSMTISSYVRQVKMEEAMRLLELDRTSCQEIAEMLAYPTASNFTDAFRKETGPSPTAWRRSRSR